MVSDSGLPTCRRSVADTIFTVFSRGRFLLAAILAASFLCQSWASAAAPQPVVRGNGIFDALTAKRFVPHGVNFPGYEYARQQGWGYGAEGTEPDDVASTVAAMASWKINTVRLPLNQDCWLGLNGLPADDLTFNELTMAGYRQSIQNFVEALNRAGIVAILDLHWSNPDGNVADGLRPMPDQHAPAFWRSVATRFGENRSVIFDLFNEPHSRWSGGAKVFGLSWQCWANGGCHAPADPDTIPFTGPGKYQAVGLKRLVSAVRDSGAVQPILLSGIDYANDLRGWRDHAPDDDQLIAGFHNYPVQRCRTVRCWDEEIAPLAREVPVLAAEFGQNDCDSPGHVRRFMEWADGHLIGYLAWAWWDLPDLGCSNFALVSDLDGTPLAPVGTTFHEHLANLPEELPEPPKRGAPGLVIRTAQWNGKRLRLAIRVDPAASKAATARVRLIRNRRVRHRPRRKTRRITRRLKPGTGLARLTLRIPRGLKPVLVTVTYPGDRHLTPGRVRRKPASVSMLTRQKT